MPCTIPSNIDSNDPSQDALTLDKEALGKKVCDLDRRSTAESSTIEVIHYEELRDYLFEGYCFVADPDLVNLEFRNPEKPRNSYCIGFRVLEDEDPWNLSGYLFDHANHWHNDGAEFENISKQALEAVFGRYNTSVEKLLSQCLQQVECEKNS